MMKTDEIRLGGALHSVPTPRGLGVPTAEILNQAKRTQRRKTAVTTSMTMLSVAGLAAAALWGGQWLLPDRDALPAVPAGEATDLEEHTYTGVHLEDIFDMTHEQQLARLAESLGVENPPEVDVVREVSPVEFDALFTECLSEKGWVAEKAVYSFPVNQERAFNLDRYLCRAAYVVIPE